MEVTETALEVKETKESSTFENLLDLLDEVEDEQVEKLRKDALRLIEEKEETENTLDLISGYKLDGLTDTEREDVENRIERLQQRLQSVQVSVTSPRSDSQQECLHAVNRAINTLIFQIQTDSLQAHMQCRQYLSAAGAEENHPMDVKFEAHLLGCTLEDQKGIKKRLLGLMDHIKAITCEGIQESA